MVRSKGGRESGYTAVLFGSAVKVGTRAPLACFLHFI